MGAGILSNVTCVSLSVLATNPELFSTPFTRSAGPRLVPPITMFSPAEIAPSEKLALLRMTVTAGGSVETTVRLTLMDAATGVVDAVEVTVMVPA